MPSELRVEAVHQGGMKVTASAGELALDMDYPLPPETACAAMRPLEVLLASLAACSVSTLALLLGRMKQPVSGLRVSVRGVRRDEHPTVFTDIALDFEVRGEGVQEEAVQKALQLAEEQICPVWNMLKSGTNITAGFRVVAE